MKGALNSSGPKKCSPGRHRAGYVPEVLGCRLDDGAQLMNEKQKVKSSDRVKKSRARPVTAGHRRKLRCRVQGGELHSTAKSPGSVTCVVAAVLIICLSAIRNGLVNLDDTA